MKTLKIEIPKGYEVCKKTSTFEEIKFRKIEDIKDRIKTVEDAIDALGSCEETLTLAVLEEHTCDAKAIARQQWVVIVKALNEDWIPDWDNEKEYKYYPWLDLRNGGVSLVGVSCHYLISDVPPSFVFKSKDLCQYAVSQFLNVLEVAWS